jgi:hypothetical protein
LCILRYIKDYFYLKCKKLLNITVSQTWYHTPIVPATGEGKVEKALGHEIEASMGNIARPIWSGGGVEKIIRKQTFSPLRLKILIIS